MRDRRYGVLTGTSKKAYAARSTSYTAARVQRAPRARTVLLAKGVVNKTIPAILCDEDDVAGKHGATIGQSATSSFPTSPAAALTKTPRRTDIIRANRGGRREPLPTSAPAPPAAVHLPGRERSSQTRPSRKIADALEPMEHDANDEAPRCGRTMSTDIKTGPKASSRCSQHPELAFLDSAATAQRPPCARRPTRLLRGNERQPTARPLPLSVEATEAIGRCRQQMRGSSAPPRPRVVITRNASESLNLVAKSVRAHGSAAGRRGVHHHHGAPLQPHPVAAGLPRGRRQARLPLPDENGQ